VFDIEPRIHDHWHLIDQVTAVGSARDPGASFLRIADHSLEISWMYSDFDSVHSVHRQDSPIDLKPARGYRIAGQGDQPRTYQISDRAGATGLSHGTVFQEIFIKVLAYSSAPTGLAWLGLVLWRLRLDSLRP
jgi:hypothetical protein